MLLSCENIVMNFGGLTAISNLNFHVEKAEIVGLIGPNGSGKTTMFNIISGIYRPTAGSILFDNKEITGRKPDWVNAAGIARTFQNIRLFTNMTVWENVLIGHHCRFQENLFDDMFRTHRRSKEEARAANQLMELLELFKIESYKEEMAKNLPYGLQRKLEIVRALASEPKLILLDEPAAGMNPQETLELTEFIQQVRSMGTTILLVEHDMKLVMSLCDRITVLSYGKKIAEGKPVEIQKNPEVIKAYLGNRGEQSA